MKQSCDIFSDFFCANINTVFKESISPEQLKYLELKPVIKKNSLSGKENYSPISIFSNVFKIHERYNQLYDCFDMILSEKQCGFRKRFSVGNSFLPMFEKLRELLDQARAHGAFLEDLSKALTAYIMSAL